MSQNRGFRLCGFLPEQIITEAVLTLFDLNGKVDRLKAEKGRGKLVKDAEDVYALIDSLIICKNAKGTLYKELADMAKLYNLVTGMR